MKNFNLTEWALHHKQLVYYFIAVIFITGIFSYKNLGRSEDPDFTIKQMSVIVSWPGSTARQVEEQVTQNRNRLSDMKNLPIHIGNGKFVPLDQIAKISYEGEEGLVWRRNLKPTITVQANINPGATGNDIAQKTYDQLADVRSN